MQLHISAINVKIVVFIELNDKDAYCAHENARNVRNVENIDAFMNMHQLKVTQIWDMRLNKYLKYWSLKALKSVSVTLYKLQMNATDQEWYTSSYLWHYARWVNRITQEHLISWHSYVLRSCLEFNHTAAK